MSPVKVPRKRLGGLELYADGLGNVYIGNVDGIRPVKIQHADLDDVIEFIELVRKERPNDR